jgi:hypothetical protein
MAEGERKSITLYIPSREKEEIEDYFLECKIKNFQEGYREIISLGFDAFKKTKRRKL